MAKTKKSTKKTTKSRKGKKSVRIVESNNKIVKVAKMLQQEGMPMISNEQPYYFSNQSGSLTAVLHNGSTPLNVNISPSETLSIGSVAAYGAFVAFVFRYSNQVTGYGTIFDAYQFVKTKYKIDLLTDYTVASSSSERALIPEVYIINDYDDAGVPTSNQLTTAIGYANSRLKRMTSQSPSITGSFQPHFISNIQDAIETGRISEKGTTGWVDLASPNVDHFGLKLYFNNILSSDAGAPIFRVQFQHFMKFRTPR